MSKTPKPLQLDLPTLEYIINLCEKNSEKTHSRMVWAAWQELQEELKEIKEEIIT